MCIMIIWNKIFKKPCFTKPRATEELMQWTVPFNCNLN